MTKSLTIAALAAATALTLSACGGDIGSEPELRVARGTIEMGATPDRPAAGYFTIIGGPRDVELVEVTTARAPRVGMPEIGIAPCWERGCLDVKSSVVAVSFKQTKQHK